MNIHPSLLKSQPETTRLWGWYHRMASLQLDRIGFFQTRKYVFIFMYWNHWIQTSQTRHKYPNSILMTNNKNTH